MLNQSDQVTQSAVTPEELRQAMVDAIDVEQKAIEELSDEQLEEIAGGGWATGPARAAAVVFTHVKNNKSLYQLTAGSMIVGAISGTVGGLGL